MEAITNGFLLFHKGGIVMYILLLCSLFVVYIGMERAIFYTHMDAGAAFARNFYTYMKLGQYDTAYSAGDTFAITANTTLYANWQKKAGAAWPISCAMCSPAVQDGMCALI